MELDPSPNLFGLSDEESALIAGYVASQITAPFTEWAKKRFKTSGVTTQRVSWAVAVAWVLMGNWMLNPSLFTGGFRSILYTLIGAGFAVWKARAQWALLKNSTQAGIQQEEPLQVVPAPGGDNGKN